MTKATPSPLSDADAIAALEPIYPDLVVDPTVAGRVRTLVQALDVDYRHYARDLAQAEAERREAERFGPPATVTYWKCRQNDAGEAAQRTAGALAEALALLKLVTGETPEHPRNAVARARWAAVDRRAAGEGR